MKKILYFTTIQDILNFEYISLKILRLLTEYSNVRIAKLSIYFIKEKETQDFYFFYDFNVEGLKKFTDGMSLSQALDENNLAYIKNILKMTELIANEIRENFLNSTHLPQKIFNDRYFYHKDHSIVKPQYKFQIIIEYKPYENQG